MSAVYFASDVHLRLDHPERGRRFAAFVDELTGTDRLVLGGDLHDFWFVSRQFWKCDPLRECPGLAALARFRRRGGTIEAIAGNHDAWLGPLYNQVLDLTFHDEPWERHIHGLAVHLTHGHRVGARPAWKGIMERKAFLKAFARLPNLVAQSLDRGLDRANSLAKRAADRKYLDKYRRYTRECAADLILFGHLHVPLDERIPSGSRLIVLGGWHQQGSYLRVDERGAELVVRSDLA